MSRLLNALQGFKSGWLGTTNTGDTGATAGLNALPESFARKCCDAFNVESAESLHMYMAINAWNTHYRNSDSQLMKTICAEAARLTLTDAEIVISQGTISNAKYNWLKSRTDQLIIQLQEKLELGYVLGSLVIKPCVDGLEVITPLNYIPIEYDFDGKLVSAIFIKRRKSQRQIVTMLEYHHFVDENYQIDSKIYASSDWSSLGYCIASCPFNSWHYEDHVTIAGLSEPLFSQFRVPLTNNIDELSNSGISLCSSCFNLLVDFDKQYKEFVRDLLTARRTVFMSNKAMQKINSNAQLKSNPSVICVNPAPDFIIGYEGTKDEFFEFNPTLNVDDRKAGLQTQLDMISSSIGFTAGYFSFDNIKGGVTATQIESEDQRTAATIASLRKPLESAVIIAVKQLNILSFVYDLFNESDFAPIDVTFTALDLSVTPAEDRERVLELVKLGYYPLQKYLAEFEGLTDEEISLVIQKNELSEDNSKMITGKGTVSEQNHDSIHDVDTVSDTADETTTLMQN